MARVIQEKCGKDVLEVVKWKEIVVIYVHSVILNVFIVLKNVLRSLKNRFDHKIGPTRQKVVHKFPALSLIGSGEAKTSKQQHQPITCPRQLMDSQLGSHKYIKLKKTKLHYVESGADHSNAVLLLHGFPDCFFGWRYQIPALSQSHRVIALDLKGFNDSDKPILRHNYRPNVLCTELKDFLETLGIEEVTVIGHDLGGLLGWIFALKFPKLVTKLVVISAPHPNLFWNISKVAVVNKKWCTMVQSPLIPEHDLNSKEGFFEKFYRHLNDEGAAMFLQSGGKVCGTELISTYKYIFNSSLDWTGPLNYYRNLLFYRVKRNYSVKCPCVIISGNEDPNYKLETIIKSGEFCENPTIRIIEGAGRFPHQSHKTEVNQILRKILIGEARKPEIIEENCSVQRGLVGRMINKMYGHVEQTVNANLFG